jgi:hypothetical protein
MTGNTPVRARLAQPPTTPAPAGQGGDWRQQAPCRQPCLETAPRGPQAHNDHHGIFAGTTAKQRITLRGRPSMAQGTRFLQDRAEEALALANRVSIDRAAQQLGVSKQALRRAFDDPWPGSVDRAPGWPRA